jgi:hypothetical protein
VPDQDAEHLELVEEPGRDEIVPAVTERRVDLSIDDAISRVDEAGRVAERARVALQWESRRGGR